LGSGRWQGGRLWLQHDWKIDDPLRGAGARSPHAEGPKIALVQVQHPHDPRRQRQHDIGLLGLTTVVREQSADEWEVAEPGDAFEHTTLVVSDQASQQVCLTVLQANDRIDFAIPECRQSTEPRSRNAPEQDSHRQLQLAVVYRTRGDLDIDAEVL
jgi:hypothetical protein